MPKDELRDLYMLETTCNFRWLANLLSYKDWPIQCCELPIQTSSIHIQKLKGFLHLLIQDYVTSYLILDMQVNLMRILKRLRNE